MRSLTEIRIAGFGGQGVILSAIIIGKAGCIYRARLRHHDAELSARKRAAEPAARSSFSPTRQCSIPM